MGDGHKVAAGPDRIVPVGSAKGDAGPAHGGIGHREIHGQIHIPIGAVLQGNLFRMCAIGTGGGQGAVGDGEAAHGVADVDPVAGVG